MISARVIRIPKGKRTKNLCRKVLTKGSVFVVLWEALCILKMQFSSRSWRALASSGTFADGRQDCSYRMQVKYRSCATNEFLVILIHRGRYNGTLPCQRSEVRLLFLIYSRLQRRLNTVAVNDEGLISMKPKVSI